MDHISFSIHDQYYSLKLLPEDLCSGFLRPEKNHRTQPGLNPRTLDLEANTLPRDHWSRQCDLSDQLNCD